MKSSPVNTPGPGLGSQLSGPRRRRTMVVQCNLNVNNNMSADDDGSPICSTTIQVRITTWLPTYASEELLLVVPVLKAAEGLLPASESIL